MLLGSLLTAVVPELVIASLPAPGKVDPPPPLIHSASAPGTLPSAEGINVGPVSKPSSYRATSADSAVQPLGSPHSPSHSRHHTLAQTPRSASVNGASPNEDRKHARHRAETQPHPTTKPPPNSRNLTPASSASSSPRHVPIALPSTPALPPTTTMTPTAASQRRPSILVSTVSLVHAHARRPSMYGRGVSSAPTPSESPSMASASDRSLRHVGEGALDDSDSSDGAASESVAESHASEVDHVEAPLTAPVKLRVSKARSMSAGRVGPAHPSPLSRLAGQQQWIEDDDRAGRSTAPAPVPCPTGHIKRPIEDESPSPVSSDTDGERSDESEGEVPQRAVRMKSRSRSRKAARRFKTRSRSSTVASLAAAPLPLVVSPARSSPSRAAAVSPKTCAALERTGSQSSVQTVIAASLREQENEGVGESGKVVAGDGGSGMWTEMSYERKVAAVEEEGKLREAGWRALREALEEYADEVYFFFLFVRGRGC